MKKYQQAGLLGLLKKIIIFGFTLNIDILTMEETLKRMEYLLKMVDYIKICQ